MAHFTSIAQCLLHARHYTRGWGYQDKWWQMTVPCPGSSLIAQENVVQVNKQLRSIVIFPWWVKTDIWIRSTFEVVLAPKHNLKVKISDLVIMFCVHVIDNPDVALYQNAWHDVNLLPGHESFYPKMFPEVIWTWYWHNPRKLISRRWGTITSTC